MNSTTQLDFFSNGQLYYSASYFIIVSGLSIVLGLLGDFYVVFNAIDSIAMIYFLFFTNVVFPNNVLDFSKFFGRYLYDLVPNPIDSKDSNSTTLSYAYSRHTYTPYFLYNASYTLMFISAIIVIYLILKGLSCLNYFEKLRRLLYIGWEWNAPIYLLVIATNQIAFFCALQAYTISLESTFISILNFSLFILCSVIVIVAPFYFGYLVYRRRFDFQKPVIYRNPPISFLGLVKTLKISLEESSDNPIINLQQTSSQNGAGGGAYSNQLDMNSPSIDQNYSSYNVNDLQLESLIIYTPEEQLKFYRISKYLNPIIMLRRLIFAAILIFFNDSVKISMGVMIAANTTLLVGYIVVRPYVLKIDNYRNALVEIAFIGLEGINFFFDENVTSSSTPVTQGTQFTLGYCYILICLVVLLVVVVDLAYKTIRALRDFGINDSVEKENKVIPIKEDYILDEEKLSEPANYNENPKKELPQKEQPNQQPQKEQPSRSKQPSVQEQQQHTPNPIAEQRKSIQKPSQNNLNPENQPESLAAAPHTQSVQSNNPELQKHSVLQNIQQQPQLNGEQQQLMQNQQMKGSMSQSKIPMSDDQTQMKVPMKSQQNFGNYGNMQMKPAGTSQLPQSSINTAFNGGEQQQQSYQARSALNFNHDADNSHTNLQPNRGMDKMAGINHPKQMPLVQEDFKVQKQRMKKALFKRNPFISQNDEELLSQVKMSSQNHF